jgi:ABC-type multidrug transport system fused ATPase/permease subunit
MKNFLKSLRYLWPYRFRIGIAIGCVVVIAVLWGGGLGLLLPGAKILLSPEGLHGWAWNSMTEDRLGARVVQRVAPADVLVEGEGLSVVVDVVSTAKVGPAESAGLKDGDWIIGLVRGAKKELIRGDVMVRELSLSPKGGQIQLWVLSQKRNERTVTIALADAGLTSSLLGEAAQRIPEPHNYKGRFPIFIGLLLIVLVVTLLRAFFTYLQEYFVGTAIWRGIMDLRCDNYNVVLHLPTSFFSEEGVSDTTSRFIQDTNELARGQNTLLGKTMVEPAKAISVLVVALALPDMWKMTLAAMLAGPPAFWLIRKFGKRMHKASKRALQSWSDMLAVLEETLLGIRVVKSYTMEGSERRRFFRVNRQLLKQQARMEQIDAATGPVIEVLGLAAGLGAAAVAGYMVFDDRIDPFVFLTWIGALFALFDPMRKLGKVATKFQQADAAAERLFELQTSPQETVVRNAPTLARHSKSLAFRDVTFSYPTATRPAVNNVNLEIAAGSTVAIVGSNGSGKTTLVSLIPRLFDPQSGQILIDGHDIRQCSMRSLRRQLAVVTQDAVIFHASIADNIAYGKHRTAREEVLSAARKAYVDEFVVNMPNGFDTVAGEHGATLSGGQKQRIALARAILRNPAIFILDEAMSQVDPDSERKIHAALADFRKGRTTLLIAHRLSSVLEADQIVVMENGAVVDVGNHADLLARCRVYHQLYQSHLTAPDVM